MQFDGHSSCYELEQHLLDWAILRFVDSNYQNFLANMASRGILEAEIHTF